MLYIILPLVLASYFKLKGFVIGVILSIIIHKYYNWVKIKTEDNILKNNKIFDIGDEINTNQNHPSIKQNNNASHISKEHKSKLDSKFLDRENKTEKIKELMDIIEIPPPEKKYAQPRKIDWESVNKTKQITGMKGEEIALEMEIEYLKSINRNDLSEKVKHVSKEIGDGLGYDILSFFPDEQEKYIEVKSTGKSNTNSFNISSNELNFMKDNKNNTYIYKILNVNDSDEVPTLEIITAETVLNSDQIIPTQYLVKL